MFLGDVGSLLYRRLFLFFVCFSLNPCAIETEKITLVSIGCG